jgi:serine/threonine protein kinase
MQKDSLKSVGALFDVPLGPLELSLVKRLGKGNFGSVYQCECRGSQVAVKMPLLKPGKGLKELKAAFVKEATILMRVSHRHVVQLRGVIDAPFQLDGNRSEFSIVTELLDCDVGFLFDINPKVCDSLVQRVTWAFQVVQGLAWIHGHGIVHRDLKIENLLYDRSSNIVKGNNLLLDF